MPEKQFLDYDGLKRYHGKLKEQFESNGSDNVSLAKRVETLEIDIELIKTGMAYATIFVQTADGVMIPDVKIAGFRNSDKSEKLEFTDSNGIASGYITPGTSYTLSISNMLDIENSTLKIDAPVSGNKYKFDWIVVPSSYKKVSSTGSYYASSYYTSFDCELIGGGGGGAGSVGGYSNGYTTGYGGGGGGGETQTYSSMELTPRTPYQISIGSGGSAGSGYSNTSSNVYVRGAGGDGGSTSAFGLTAAGGGGGGRRAITTTVAPDVSYGGTSSNGGRGGNAYGETTSAAAGSNGTVYYHKSLTETALAAGGGGGGSYNGARSGGQSCGGAGGNLSNTENTSTNATGKSGSSPGGGGGGGSDYSSSRTKANGGSGGSGAVILIFS